MINHKCYSDTITSDSNIHRLYTTLRVVYSLYIVQSIVIVVQSHLWLYNMYKCSTITCTCATTIICDYTTRTSASITLRSATSTCKCSITILYSFIGPLGPIKLYNILVVHSEVLGVLTRVLDVHLSVHWVLVHVLQVLGVVLNVLLQELVVLLHVVRVLNKYS